MNLLKKKSDLFFCKFYLGLIKKIMKFDEYFGCYS